MRIIVPIKQVPETSKVSMDPVTGTMIREGLEAIVNPLDLYAIEAALALRAQCGGEVVVVSMGPPKAATALKEAVAMGADAAVLLSDKAFAGSDTWATSYVLAAAIRKLCGMGVPPMLPAWHGRLAHAPRVAWASRPCSPCGTGVSPMLPDGTGVPPTKGADYELIQQRQGACLPHWTRDEAAYAVNFRLADSMPQSVLEAWQNEREEIVKRAAAKGRQLTRQEQEDLDALYSEKVQAYLDAGHGDCHLRRPEVAAIVADALKHFDGIRYQLLAWCIMPNHVHLVVRPSAEFELSKSLHSLKSFTAHKANELLGREGPFWQSEYYDHLIRDEEDLWHSIEYAWKNPDKAGLQEWKWREKINWQEYEEQSQEHGRDAHATQQEHGRDAHATLILCGERATDGDTGQVGPAIAAWLDLPVVTYVSSIDPADGFVRVRRLVENGHEVLEADTPAVLTVVKEIGDPRLPTLAGKLRAKSLEIPVWTAADLDVDPARLGLAGSPTRVVKIFKPKVARQCQKLPAGDDASAARAVEQLVQLLRQRELIP